MNALKFPVKLLCKNERGILAFRIAAFRFFLAAGLLFLASGSYAENLSFVEFGVAGDLTVLGQVGTAVDPNVKIKGFTVFGSTQTYYTGIVPGNGNVVINGSVSVSSGAYFSATSTFPEARSIVINDGAAGQVLVKAADGHLEWKDGAAAIGGAYWSPFPFAAGFLDLGGGWQAVQYRKIGDIVYLRGAISKNSSFAPGDVLGTLPPGFRPPAPVSFSCFAPAGTAGIAIVVAQTGQISVADTIIGHSAPERTKADLSAVHFSVTP